MKYYILWLYQKHNTTYYIKKALNKLLNLGVFVIFLIITRRGSWLNQSIKRKSMKFKALSAPSLKELFVTELENMILSGELEIGSQLLPKETFQQV